MISKTEREKLKRTIGSRHINQICTYLVKNRLFNHFGDPYTNEFVSRVFNGRVENLKMEGYIIDFAATKKKEEEERERKEKEREEFFNSIPATHEE